MVCIRNFCFCIIRYSDNSRSSLSPILLQIVQIIHDDFINGVFRSHELQQSIHRRLYFGKFFYIIIMCICSKCRQGHTCDTRSLMRIHSLTRTTVFFHQCIHQLSFRCLTNNLYSLFQILSFCQFDQNSQNISSSTQTCILLIIETTKIFSS